MTWLQKTGYVQANSETNYDTVNIRSRDTLSVRVVVISHNRTSKINLRSSDYFKDTDGINTSRSRDLKENVIITFPFQ